jgi:hypothetical protein
MFEFTSTTGGIGYINIRVGDVASHNIHEVLLDATALAASRDADGNLPPGLPVSAAGGLVTSGTAYGYIGPEPVRLGTANTFGNVIRGGGLNRDAIEDNLGRVLSAAEIAGQPSAVIMY